MRKVAEELMPVLKQLQSEGIKVYSYNYDSLKNEEITGLFWYENGRMLNIQGSSWRNFRYARDRFELGVSYIPSRENGSGCGLSPHECGVCACDILKYRKYPTWVKRIENFKSIDHFLKTRPEFKEIDSTGNMET